MTDAVFHSPDSSIKAEGSSHVQSVRLAMPATKDLILWVLLGVSLAGNLFNWYYSHDAKTQAWLAEDTMQKLETGPLSELTTRVNVNESLINAYGLAKQCRKE